MDEMSADEQLGLPVRQFTNRVRRPYFLEECLSHLSVTEQPFALKGKILRKEKSQAYQSNKRLVALEEFVEEGRRFIRDADDLVRCLTIEFEIELGPGLAVIPGGEMFEIVPAPAGASRARCV